MKRNEAYMMTPPVPVASRIDVTVNVVVSGTIVVEFRSTSDAADLKKLTDSLAKPTADLQTAVNVNPVPTAP